MPTKNIVQKKTPMPEQPPAERVRNFNEVALGYTPEQAMTEAQRCLQCARPACVMGCPANVNIPRFIKLIIEEKFQEAIDSIRATNALPAVTGRVCPQEQQCEKECVLAKRFDPVAIGRLERFVADWEMAKNTTPEPRSIHPTGKRVAVVGSGPAGITVAADLSKLGHEVVIFEALHETGGVLTYGIPEFRLPKGAVRHEVDTLRSTGVRVVKDFVVGKTATVDELLEDYDAVFLGTGAGLPWFLNIPGEGLNGVYSANEYLTRVNLMKAYKFPEYDTPIARGRRVVTIGGGNVAMDAARTALRLGAENSTVLYRRSREEMPARSEEIQRAEEEGVRFALMVTPVVFHGDEKGNVTDVEGVRNTLGDPDSSGRRRPIPIEGSNFTTPADVVIIAVGQSPNPMIPNTTPDLKVGKGGVVTVDAETLKTSKKGVFAGGDVATGGATVILAIGHGKKAAKAIDEYLRTNKW